MKFSQNLFILKHFFLLIKIIILLLLSTVSFANEKKIGSVTELNGTIVVINETLEERDLLIHDPIFLNEEIFVTEGSSATIQFEDNTAIIMKELTSLNVNEFENSKKNPKIKAKLLKGKITIESGSIAKNSNGEMLVDILTSSLGLRGTRVEINLKTDGKSDISLAEDSFGNVGELEVSSAGQTSNITSPDQVIEVSETNELSSREKTNQEKENEKIVSEILIKSSKIDETEIEKQLQKKLDDGKLQDANNDGIVDDTDIQLVKDEIAKEKKQKIDFIVENSKDENTEFLSDVINQSDEKNTGEVIEKIIDTQDNLVEGVVENLSDKDNKFLTTTTSEGAGLIKEKIFETIVSKETEKSAEILSKVMAKADTPTINSVINNITEKNTNTESKLSLKVMADFSEKNPEKLETLSQTNSDQIDKLTVSAVDKASTSNEDAELIAKVVASASDELVNKVVEEVSKNSTDENQTLSAKVLKAIVDTEPNKLEIINDNIKDTLIKQTIVSAENQQEGIGVQEIEDMSSIVSDIIVNTNTETGSKIIEELNKSDSETNLSLKIISAISEKDTEKLNKLSENNKEQIEKFTETAIKHANNNNEDTDLIAKVVVSVNEELANNIVEEVSKNSTEERLSLSAKVLNSVIDIEPDKVEIINDDLKQTIIGQTLNAAKNQAEGIFEDNEDLSNTIAEIVNKAEISTASDMINSLGEITENTESNLSLNIIENLGKKENFEEKLEILSITSTVVDGNINKILTDAVTKAVSDEDIGKVKGIILNSKGTLADKLINSANKNEENKKKVSNILTSIIEDDPNKAIEIIQKNKKTNTVIDVIKNKIEKKEAITSDDFEKVFDTNVSPN